MTIGRKLMLAFGVSLALTAALSVECLTAVGGLGARLEFTASATTRKTELVGELKSVTADVRAAVRQAVLSTSLRDDADYRNARASVTASLERMNALLDELRPLLESRDTAAADSIAASLTGWKAAIDRLDQACREGKADEANQIRKGPQRTLANAITKAADEIAAAQREVNRTTSAEARSFVQSSRWTALMFVAIALASALGGFMVLHRSLAALRGVASRVDDTAEQLAQSAGQASASSQVLASGATQQAASLEESSAAAEQVSGMSRSNAEHARAAADLMSEAATRVRAANESLTQMVDSMGQIRTSSDKISRIIRVIDEIAFQTNILALNAAVEAARAGEVGMGFGVVADEVRSLSQRCAQAARDTSVLIEESIQRSVEAAECVDGVANSVRGVTDLALQAKNLVDEINAGSQEQNRGVTSITEAIVQIQEVVQSSAASAEQGAATGSEMSSQADSMRDVAKKLRYLVGAA
ncbi:MAG: MCP four helix bundle domain-containing protein [Acidobacteria bacterium]|nr:MCP four helix bundle domain-containing protein [Acidobacteriota bacterium]